MPIWSFLGFWTTSSAGSDPNVWISGNRLGTNGVYIVNENELPNPPVLAAYRQWQPKCSSTARSRNTIEFLRVFEYATLLCFLKPHFLQTCNVPWNDKNHPFLSRLHVPYFSFINNHQKHAIRERKIIWPALVHSRAKTQGKSTTWSIREAWFRQLVHGRKSWRSLSVCGDSGREKWSLKTLTIWRSAYDLEKPTGAGRKATQWGKGAYLWSLDGVGRGDRSAHINRSAIHWHLASQHLAAVRASDCGDTSSSQIKLPIIDTTLVHIPPKYALPHMWSTML